jgi:hypothetical protein
MTDETDARASEPVAPPVDVLRALDELARCARDPTWWTPPRHDSMGLELLHALGDGTHFRWRWGRRQSYRWADGGAVADLEWVGAGDPMADFYALFGRFVEPTAFVHHAVEGDTYLVTTVFGYTAEPRDGHGHLVRFRLGGPRVEEHLHRRREGVPDAP